MSDAQRGRSRPDEPVPSEQDILRRLDELHLEVDLDAMAVVSNIYRAASAIRRHMEHTALSEARLSWTAFVALWVLLVWGEMEARHLAGQANVAKGTLTGVLDTLEGRGLIARRRHDEDRRQVSVALTEAGERLIVSLVPRFNREESRIAALMTSQERDAATSVLRRIVRELPGSHE